MKQMNDSIKPSLSCSTYSLSSGVNYNAGYNGGYYGLINYFLWALDSSFESHIVDFKDIWEVVCDQFAATQSHITHSGEDAQLQEAIEV